MFPVGCDAGANGSIIARPLSKMCSFRPSLLVQPIDFSRAYCASNTESSEYHLEHLPSRDDLAAPVLRRF